MEIVRLKTSAIVPNTGQVEGLPTNPRQWTRTDIDRIAASLEQTPELFEARPLIVYPQGGKYVVLGGNLRLEGAKSLKLKECPAIVIPEGTATEKLREIVIKDNGAFGAWDYDALANEWDDLPLTEWGVPAWDDAPVDEDAVDDLFTEVGAAADKGLAVSIEVPQDYEDNLEDIKEAIRVTLAEWPGCKVK